MIRKLFSAIFLLAFLASCAPASLTPIPQEFNFRTQTAPLHPEETATVAPTETVEPSPTPVELPKELGAKFIEEAEKSDYKFEIRGDEVWMDFNDGVGFEKAFVKQADGSYETYKFKITREPVSVDDMFCRDLIHRLQTDYDCVQEIFEDRETFFVTFRA